MISADRARSSVGERSLHTREVAGSKPAAPIRRVALLRQPGGFEGFLLLAVVLELSDQSVAERHHDCQWLLLLDPASLSDHASRTQRKHLVVEIANV